MLSDILMSQVQWTPYGIVCRDSEQAKMLHKFLREAILDRHVYISKAVSFTFDISNPVNAESNKSIGRNANIGESFPDIINNLSDKVFYKTNAKHAKIDLFAKNNTMSDSRFMNRIEELEVLYINPNICRLIAGTGALHINIDYNCGFSSMSDNSATKPKSHFPCYTDFSIAEYFRIPPMEKGASLVPIRYYYNATPDVLQSILIKWLLPENRDQIKEEEKLWLQRYDQ